MTVRELIMQLATLPGNVKVVVDASCDFRDFQEVTQIVPGEFHTGICGGDFHSDSPQKNAILLS